MSTTLTQDDLTAIAGTIKPVVDTAIEELKLHIAAGFEDMDGRFEQVYEKFEKIDVQFVKIGERFDNMDQRFDKMDRRFDNMDRRFNQVDEDMTIIKSSVNRIERIQSAEIERVDRQESNIQRMRKALKTI